MDIGVGDIVECVDAGQRNEHPTLEICTGAVYTVKSVFTVPECYRDRGSTGVALREVEPAFGAMGYHADRFRPLKRRDEAFLQSLTRFPALYAFLTGGDRNRVRNLAQARQTALEAYDAAVSRGDTRSKHTTWKALYEATNAQLRGR